MLNNKVFSILIILTSLFLQNCAKVEDYMLGKDNTPKPEPLQKVSQKLSLVEKWSVPVGKGINFAGKLKPQVENNFVYVAHSNGIIQAIDKKSGTLKWSTTLSEKIISGPEVKDQFIALGSNASIILLNKNNGKTLWRATVSGDVLAKPVIADNKVLVKTIDGSLYAFDVKNGEKLWVDFHGAPNLILQASSSPIVVDKFAFVGFSDGNLDAIDLRSGNIVWQKSISYATGASDIERLVDIDTDPIVVGDIIYLATYQGYIGALSLKTGEFIWKKPASTYKNLALDDNKLYMTDSNDVIWAFNRSDGQVLWKQVSLKARNLTEPVIMDKHLVVGDKTGFLHVLAIKDGEILSRTKLSGPIEASPSVSEKNMFVLTSNGKLNNVSIG